MGSLRSQIAALVIAAVLPIAAPAHAELGTTGALTVGLSVSAGIQPDGRGCDTAGTSRTVPATNACILFAAGTEASLLYRGHIGAAFGVWSVAGQAATIPQGANGAAGFPDRVSIPLLLDLRPLSFLSAAHASGYYSRFLYGVRIALGPSLEIVRTSTDSSIDWGGRIGSTAQAIFGMHVSLDAELPLQPTPNGLSLRFSTRILYVPAVVLNDGSVESAPISTSTQSPTDLGNTFQGYATQVQVYLGLVYYL
jgi:hypothetical protein